MSAAAGLAEPRPTAESSSSGRAEALWERYRAVRDFTRSLTCGLEPEDCVVQSMPDVSPTKWHLAHTTWFFETFLLKKFQPGYVSAVPEYAYLFNSYYNAAGPMHRRDLRGLISRPTMGESLRYRQTVDREVEQLLNSASSELLDELEPLIVLGVNHEQQHQELLITDIKHVLAQNPLHPVYAGPARSPGAQQPAAGRAAQADPAAGPRQLIQFDEAVVEIGQRGADFAYDNESPRHRVLVPAFSLASRLVTCGEYIDFIESGGYQRPEFWLSLGWMTVNQERWEAPLYWEKHEGEWWQFTLSGFRRVDPEEPVTHVSYFEADAFANWSGARLPTEFEWERAVQGEPIEGNFVESQRFHPAACNAVILSREDGEGPHDSSKPHRANSLTPAQDERVGTTRLHQLFGDVWEWTRSSYAPYPGYRAEPGALGEYNGKFMCNQYVLRGGSCATSRSHIRRTYRNFFQPEKRWQFTGIRLAHDAV